MSVKRISDEMAIKKIHELLEHSDLDVLASIVSNYIEDGPVVVFDANSDSEQYEDGELLDPPYGAGDQAIQTRIDELQQRRDGLDDPGDELEHAEMAAKIVRLTQRLGSEPQLDEDEEGKNA